MSELIETQLKEYMTKVSKEELEKIFIHILTIRKSSTDKQGLSEWMSSLSPEGQALMMTAVLMVIIGDAPKKQQ